MNSLSCLLDFVLFNLPFEMWCFYFLRNVVVAIFGAQNMRREPHCYVFSLIYCHCFEFDFLCSMKIVSIFKFFGYLLVGNNDC